MVVGAAFTIKNETRYNMGRIRFYIYKYDMGHGR